MATFRDVVYNQQLDAYAYYEIFNWSKDITLLEYFRVSTVEPGYSLIAWLIGNIIGSYTVFLAIVHIFIYCTHCYFINKLPMIKGTILPVSIICLELFSGFYLQRNIIAVSFALILWVKIYEHKYIAAIGVLMCAVLVHYSAIILFPVLIHIWLSKKNGVKKYKIVLLEMLFIIFLVLFGRPFFNMFSENDKYYIYGNTGSVAIATDVFAIIIMMIFLQKIKIMDKKKPFIVILGISLFSILLIIPLQLQFSIMYRMILFFLPAMITVFFYTVREYKGINYCLLNGIMLLYSGYRIYTFFSEELSYIGIPYKFCFGGI